MQVQKFIYIGYVTEDAVDADADCNSRSNQFIESFARRKFSKDCHVLTVDLLFWPSINGTILSYSLFFLLYCTIFDLLY